MKYRKTQKIPRTKLPNIKKASIVSTHIKFFEKICNTIKILQQVTPLPSSNNKQLLNPINNHQQSQNYRSKINTPNLSPSVKAKNSFSLKKRKNNSPNKSQIQYIYGTSFQKSHIQYQTQPQLNKQVIFNYGEDSDDEDSNSLMKYDIKLITQQEQNYQQQRPYQIYNKKLLQKVPLYKERQFKINHKAQWRN